MPIWRPIQPTATGFLSLLGLKNLGRNPDALLDELRPSIDMAPWFLNGAALTRATVETWPAAAGNISGFWRIGATPITGAGDITVPDGQLWYVHEVCVEVGPTSLVNLSDISLYMASAAARIPPGAGPPGFSTPHFIANPGGFQGSPVLTAVAPVNAVTVAINQVGKFFAPAGTQFGMHAGLCNIYDTTPALMDVGANLSVRYTPLSI